MTDNVLSILRQHEARRAAERTETQSHEAPTQSSAQPAAAAEPSNHPDDQSKPKRTPKNAPPLFRSNFPTVKMFAGMIDQWIDEAEAYLVEYDDGIFSYGDLVCRIAPGPITSAHNQTVALRVVAIRPQHLIERFAKVCQFTTYDGRRDEWIAVVCPPSIAKGYLERVGLWRLRQLLGIISAPTLRRDGSILDTEGYDARSKLFADWRGNNFPPIPENPSKADAIEALRLIEDLYSEISFRDRPSRSVALSMPLCAVARHALRRVPLVGVNATSAGSGKSMLADVAAMIATGSEAPAISIGTDPEELKKTLGAELSQGAAIVSLDNCEGPVGGDLINSILTQDKVKVRILGKSEMVEIPRGALLFANGNGLTILGDLVRRTIVATLDPKMERPWTRTFTKAHPVERVRADRGSYVTAALTVLRAYQLAGCPDCPSPPLGSFEEWSHLIRGCLMWCGYADPCETMEHIRVADPKRQALAAVLHRWIGCLGGEELTTGDVIARATEREPASDEEKGRLNYNAPPRPFMFPELREALLAVAGDGGSINSHRLGRWLARNEGTIADGLRIEKGKLKDGRQPWKVVKVG